MPRLVLEQREDEKLGASFFELGSQHSHMCDCHIYGNHNPIAQGITFLIDRSESPVFVDSFLLSVFIRYSFIPRSFSGRDSIRLF
jgi:hypothetical protein